MKKLILTAAAILAVTASTADAQVDYNTRTYSSLLTVAEVETATAAGQIRIFNMYDAANNVTYLGTEETAAPFDDRLAVYNNATTTLTGIGGGLNATGGLTGFRVRDYLFDGGQLIVANRDATPDQIGVFNTTTGVAAPVVPSNPLGNGTVRRMAHLTGNTYLIADSTGAIFSLEIGGPSNGTSSATALATVANLQGIEAENATDVIVMANSGSNVTFSRITNILTSPSTTNVTPGPVSSILSANWRNFRIGPNGEWIFNGRDSAGAITLYIWTGTNLITIPASELNSESAALGNTASQYEVPDISGISVRAIDATSFALLVSSRAPNASTRVNPALMQIVFGNSTSVTDWMNY